MRLLRLVIFVAAFTAIATTSLAQAPGDFSDGPAFPRLAMWYPGFELNTVEQGSRFDLIIGNFTEPVFQFAPRGTQAASIRRANPDARLFTYYTPAVIRHASLTGRARKFNAYMGEWPARWFMTEAGTTLASGLDASQTVIKVSQWEQSGEAQGKKETTWEIFQPYYDVQCENEIMSIVSVDRASQSITVRRGMSGTAAVAHAAGVRIAPILRVWSGSYMMNMTPKCPTATIHGATVPETYNEYSFRMSRQGEISWFWNIGGDQDGFLWDFLGDEITWVMWQLARSIDLDHDNVADSFAELDRLWLAGVDAHMNMFKTTFPGVPIIRNNSRSLRFDYNNGENFMSWPHYQWEDWDASAAERAVAKTKYWHRFFFGEVTEEGDPDYEKLNIVKVGGITEFRDQGQMPNYTIIESCEFEMDLDAAGLPEVRKKGSRDYAIDPNTSIRKINWLDLYEPDYQKMRWGFTSALVAGVYYCYVINTDGHGMLGIRWFDEYDDAGRDIRYLGYPVSGIVKLANHPVDERWGVWGREYEGGFVICNPLGEATMVDLPEGRWQRIQGSQVPQINNGNFEQGYVTVPAYDGLILKRVP